VSARRTTLPSSGFRITPPRPYSLALTVERLVRFAEVVDRFEDGIYRRLLWVGGAGLRVSVRQHGPPSRAELEIRLDGREARAPAAKRAALQLVGRTLGADSDVRAFYRARRDDPLLRASIRANRGLRVAGSGSVFEAMLTAVFAQQINLAFAYSIRQELALALGRRARIDGETYTAFPTPASVARLSHEELRAFRLSNAKARALHAIADAFHSGDLSEQELEALPDEQVIERLIALRGVGRWTAEVTLMRGLGRVDAFPAGDLTVVKYLAQELLGRDDVASEKEMREFSERWRPHRALALVYAYAEMGSRARDKTAKPAKPSLRRKSPRRKPATPSR
jgi:DNA-3-methyladenine glycosylase II